jgi:hypothetical protein
MLIRETVLPDGTLLTMHFDRVQAQSGLSDTASIQLIVEYDELIRNE